MNEAIVVLATGPVQKVLAAIKLDFDFIIPERSAIAKIMAKNPMLIIIIPDEQNTYLDYLEESTQTMLAIVYLCDPSINNDYDKALDILTKTFDAAIRNKGYKHHRVKYHVNILKDTIIFSASIG